LLLFKYFYHHFLVEIDKGLFCFLFCLPSLPFFVVFGALTGASEAIDTSHPASPFAMPFPLETQELLAAGDAGDFDIIFWYRLHFVCLSSLFFWDNFFQWNS
jgi:hypothetical protein